MRSQILVRTLLVLGLLAANGVLVAGDGDSYGVYKETSLSATAEVITVQQPPSPTKTIQMSGASVYCEVECTFTVERDGAAATTTSATVVALSRFNPEGTARVYHTSNVGAGTTLVKHTVPAGTTFVVDLSAIRIDRTPGANVSIRTNSIIGVARIFTQWEEQ